MPRDHKTAKNGLARELAAALSFRPQASPACPIVRVETPIPKIDLLSWLETQEADTKIYWSDRNEAFAMAGIGIADAKKGNGPVQFEGLFSELRKNLSLNFPSLRYYGGMGFDTSAPSSEHWRPFGAYCFIIPRIELGRKDENYYLACNVAVEEGPKAAQHLQEQLDTLEAIVFPAARGAQPLPPTASRLDRPNEMDWSAMVNQVLQAFKTGSIQKVVLGRESLFEFERPLDPVALLRQLVDHTIHSYHFCFQLAPFHAFLGASPERLFRRLSVYIESEALAATRPRGTTPEEDQALAQELLASDKDLREHRFVLDTIRELFDKQCSAVRAEGTPEVLKLRHCQHLLTKVQGVLKDNLADGVLLRNLHPTPAVGGVPRGKALELIDALEPFERGWWAAPVGWVGYDAAEFAVAIRSGLVFDNTLALYSGAGIVPGSSPEEEWGEIEYKMNNFLNIIEGSGVATNPASRP